MTEPQKMGVEELMGLAITFASARYYSVGAQENEPRERLHDALTTIIEERDRAVMSECEIAAACSCYEKDRDALALRVKTLEGAVSDCWAIINYGKQSYPVTVCVFCNKNQPSHLSSPLKHDPDCIVRTIKESK